MYGYVKQLRGSTPVTPVPLQKIHVLLCNSYVAQAKKYQMQRGRCFGTSF